MLRKCWQHIVSPLWWSTAPPKESQISPPSSSEFLRERTARLFGQFCRTWTRPPFAISNGSCEASACACTCAEFRGEREWHAHYLLGRSSAEQVLQSKKTVVRSKQTNILGTEPQALPPSARRCVLSPDPRSRSPFANSIVEPGVRRTEGSTGHRYQSTRCAALA